ncbi:MAG: GNAT family N-acetyltransferase [Syntrophales bacterium]|nr:GNAT family N-acetyltransferase [Syntrophales bacterium]
MNSKEQGTVKIRPMTRTDIYDILGLDKKFGKSKSSLTYKDMVTTDPGGPLDMSFVAEAGGVIIGFAIAHVAYVMIPLAGVCILNSILVDPDYQNHGIGVRLLGKIVAHCQEEGIGTIRTLIEEQNEDLIRFVEPLGFRRSNVLNYDKTFEG